MKLKNLLGKDKEPAVKVEWTKKTEPAVKAKATKKWIPKPAGKGPKRKKRF